MALDKPASTLTVKFVGDDNAVASVELFMSFGLLNQITRIAKNLNAVLTIDLDPETIDTVLDLVFVPRDPKGNPMVEGYRHPNLSIEQAETILDWVKEHVATFFIGRLINSGKVGQAVGEALGAKPGSSPTGSTA